MPGAEMLLGRARSAASLGHYAVASRYLAQALAGSTDVLVRARVEITLAYVEAETGDPSGGIRRCEEVLLLPDLDDLTRGRA